MTFQTRSQKLAQAAYKQVARHGHPPAEYVSFAKNFPALVHTCGLAQAVAFALAKKETRYVEDLAAVLKVAGHRQCFSVEALDQYVRTVAVGDYLRLSRDAIDAASWLKRYTEALYPTGEREAR